MFRTLSLVVCAIAVSSITLENASAKLKTFWQAQTNGDAVTYHSFLSKDVKIITNNEVDVAPWTDVGFIKDLYTKLIFSDVEQAVALLPIEDSPNSFLANINWAVTVTRSGETIQMGLWSQKITFDDQDKISEIDSIADGNTLEQFGNALNLDAQTTDIKQVVEGFIASLNKKDVEGCFQKLVQPFSFTRNGHEDLRFAQESNLKYFFSKVFLQVKLEDFVLSSTHTVNMRVKITASLNDGQKVNWSEAWMLSVNQDLKLTALASIADSVPLSKIDQALSAQ